MTTYRANLRVSPADILEGATEEFARLTGPAMPRREMLRAAWWNTALELDPAAPATSQQELIDACAALMVAWLVHTDRLDAGTGPVWARLAVALRDQGVPEVCRWMLHTASNIRHLESLADDVAERDGITWPLAGTLPARPARATPGLTTPSTNPR